MRSISAVTVAIGALVVALTFAAAPVAAGPVCNELDLSSPCVRSNDMRANIALGGSSGDGRLRLRSEDGAAAVDLQASNGNLTNRFSNAADASNGLVKAWAQINPDGTIGACWRCNTDPDETNRFDPGFYEVDFTPLATDIRGRPRSATIDGGDVPASASVIFLGDRNDDPSSVFVGTTDLSGVFVDRPFVLIIY